MRRFINNVIFQKISRLKHPERLELNLIWVQVAGLNPNVRTSLLLQTLRAVPRNSGVLSAVQIPHYSSIPEADFQRVLMGTRLPRFDCKLDMTWMFFFSSCQLKKMTELVDVLQSQ